MQGHQMTDSHTADCAVHSPTLRPCSCRLETRLRERAQKAEADLAEAQRERDEHLAARIEADSHATTAVLAQVDLTKLLATTQAQLDEAQARLSAIGAASKADADDLAKMRDGTKMTRAGLVEIIVYQQQDAEKAEADLAALRVAERLNMEYGISLKTEIERLRKDAERYRARRQEEYMRLLKGLPNGHTTSCDAIYASYDAYSDSLDGGKG